jgi:hypothetical protein
MDVTWTPITSAFRVILIPWVSFYDVVAFFLATSNTFYVLIVYLTSLFFNAKIKTGFHGLFINSTCVLQHVFHLSLLQVISVLIRMDVFPNCAYFFDLAVYKLVERKVMYHGNPVAIGHHIAIRMLHYFDLYYADRTTPKGKRLKLGVFWYYSFKQFPLVPDLLSPSAWIECVVNKCFFLLLFFIILTKLFK